MSDQTALNITCQAALSGALTELKSLPAKLNPVIKPLMESIKKEESEILQKISSEQLAHLIELCVDRNPCPNPKIISNLCTFLCSDPEFTPRINNESSSNNSDKENTTGILTLINQQRIAERTMLKRQSSTGGRGPGRPPLISNDGFVPENLFDDEVINF